MSELCPVCGSERKDGEGSCHACGFKFLESTQEFEPIKVPENASAETSAEAAGNYHLRVVRGPQIERIYPLGDERQSIGRDPNCDIFLNDTTVSRKHAFIGPVDRSYVIQDNDSYNGLWINGKNLSTKVLKLGDIIQLGVFCLIFEKE